MLQELCDGWSKWPMLCLLGMFQCHWMLLSWPFFSVVWKHWHNDLIIYSLQYIICLWIFSTGQLTLKTIWITEGFKVEFELSFIVINDVLTTQISTIRLYLTRTKVLINDLSKYASLSFVYSATCRSIISNQLDTGYCKAEHEINSYSVFTFQGVWTNEVDTYSFPWGSYDKFSREFPILFW